MKQYKYKIQWMFSISSYNGNIQNEYFEEFKTFLRLIYVRSLDKIILRDSELNIIEEYNDFLMYSGNEADDKAIEYIKNSIEKNPKITRIEVLKK